MTDKPTFPRTDSVTFTVPLNVTLSFGNLPSGPTAGTARGDDDAPGEAALEKVVPDPSDPDYENRPGYDEDFLGFKVAFPKLTTASRPSAFKLAGMSGDKATLIKYHHFSVIFNEKRKLAFVAGVNYDPTAKVVHPRDKDGDKWYYDKRVTPPEEIQAGESLYAGNPLDRGHLVRRADAGWGATKKEAKLANDDTFHFTNCSPQHAITNQGKIKEAPPGLKLWGKLEDHVASQGKQGKRRLSIFNGPVFRTNDATYRGVKIPKEFWKVVVFQNDEGDPSAVAFVLTQADLIEDLEEEFTVGEYKSVQVRISDLQTKTKLDFGKFVEWDVFNQEGAEESFTGESGAIALNSVRDILL